ncbi:MAG: DUF1579 domain-containing protein [Pirellula sp.]|jgi:hypothetical protein
MKSLCSFLAFGLVIFFATATGSAQIPGPTAEHAKWKPYVGKWNFELTDSENQVSKGTNETVESCGGLWFVTTMETNMAGMPFQGKGLDGYDPEKKKYISVWVDSFTASPMIFEGEYDKAGKVLTMICEGKDPTSGGAATWRSTSEFMSKDEYRFVMFVKPKDGKEQQMMTVIYKRAK